MRVGIEEGRDSQLRRVGEDRLADDDVQEHVRIDDVMQAEDAADEREDDERYAVPR